MMPIEQRVAELNAFRVAHDERHDSLEKVLNLRFDDLKKQIEGISDKIHTHSSMENGKVSKDIVIKIMLPSAGVGAGALSLLYWVSQMIGR